RLVGANPEAKRLVRLALLEKIAEVGRQVEMRYRLEWRLELVFLVRRPGRVASEPAGLEIARSPTLARMTDLVARVLQQLRINRKLRRKDPEVTARLFELPGVAARQNAGPAGAAFGVRSEAMREQRPLA